MNIDDIEHGVDQALIAIIAVAQQGMVANAKGPECGPFVGFLQAIVENKETFKQQIMVVAIERHPSKGEG